MTANLCDFLSFYIIFHFRFGILKKAKPDKFYRCQSRRFFWLHFWITVRIPNLGAPNLPFLHWLSFYYSKLRKIGQNLIQFNSCAFFFYDSCAYTRTLKSQSTYQKYKLLIKETINLIKETYNVRVLPGLYPLDWKVYVENFRFTSARTFVKK